MSVLDREALEQSPLADLHAIASELSIDSYRLLRREQLVDAILTRQEGADGGAGAAVDSVDEVEPPTPKPRRRRSRQDSADEAKPPATPKPRRSRSRQEPADEAKPATTPKPRRRRTRQERTARAQTEPAPDTEPATEAEPAPEEEAAPAVEAVPGAEAAETTPDAVSDRARFESLPATFPDEPLGLAVDDATVAAIESLTPIGKGSRVTITGPARAGKTEALRRLAMALQGHDDLQLLLLLVGVRPEEIGEWQAGPLEPVQAISFATPASAQDRAVYGLIDEVRTIALNGGDVVILLDTLDGLHEQAARRALATARKLRDGGSVTLIATSSEPLGGETTVVTLNPALTGAGRFPALDLPSSGTMRPELLVGKQRADRILRARAKAAR